jgi:hypothetical protein
MNKEYDDALGTKTYKCLKLKEEKHLKLFRARVYNIGLTPEIIIKRMHHESEILSLLRTHPNIVSLH